MTFFDLNHKFTAIFPPLECLRKEFFEVKMVPIFYHYIFLNQKYLAFLNDLLETDLAERQRRNIEVRSK